ncbi:hypothetical protein GCM10027404_11200 [Arthrobacter tumbae]|uniref:phosphatase PAP2 family protein n=1 Tax=Arthrobacter tumbae TaxID=163874 RepID=UPI001958B7D5|nr:phosphatase PAP2 family protein [Arthrobacter tumbae]MBM7782400.1 undecaprenyl-diphosphatase [Arthrobacter tumbae]
MDVFSMIIDILGGGAAFVAEVAAHVGWLVLPSAALFLAIRKLWHHVLLVAGTALGLATLTVPGTLPTFFNGTLEFVATAVILLFIFLPAVPPRARRWTIPGTLAAVTVFEVVRVAAGQQSALSTVGGAVAGAAWAVVASILFRRWRQPEPPRRRLTYGLPVSSVAALHPAPLALKGQFSFSRWIRLVAVGVMLCAALTAVGLLITGPLGGVARFDRTVVQWLASHRSEPLSALATVAGAFGTTAGVVAVLLVGIPLLLALTRRWVPVVFLLAAAVGETSIYLVTGLIVGRGRPAVDHLSEGLPPTSSFPSGHVAAAVVVYGGLALLLYSTGRFHLRWAGFLLAGAIVLGVAASRLYWGVHFPTDVLASMAYAPVWLAACWTYLVRDPRSRMQAERQTAERDKA